MKIVKYISLVILTFVVLRFGTAQAQDNLAQEAYTIFQQKLLNMSWRNMVAHTEQLVIQSRQGLIDTGTVIPGNPEGSEFYRRLIEKTLGKRMPLGQPPLAPELIETIRRWIEVGAPNWQVQYDINFITTDAMLDYYPRTS